NYMKIPEELKAAQDEGCCSGNGKGEIQGAFHPEMDDEAVRGSGRDDVVEETPWIQGIYLCPALKSAAGRFAYELAVV
ncbi:MAG TPA: hypothetical protein VMU57_16600, partial [Edaphobacter sp.]|uniref:hypothetical protein n=1 Tax=Edaphobacter sp. TaxID=1934404 RepID=UPI002B6F4539